MPHPQPIVVPGRPVTFAPGSFNIFTPGFIVVELLAVVLNVFLQGGMLRMAIKHVRTGQADIGEMFSVVDVLPNLLLASLLTTLAYLLGLVLCILPGFYVALALSMTIPLVVDQKIPAVDAMKKSWSVVSKNIGPMFLLGLVMFCIYLAGFIACCVGILVAIPLITLTFAVVYRDLFLAGDDIAIVPSVPLAPIALPN